MKVKRDTSTLKYDEIKKEIKSFTRSKWPFYILIMCAVFSLYAAWLIKECVPFFSSALTGCFGGFVTGIIIYYISRHRERKNVSIVELHKSVVDKLEQIQLPEVEMKSYSSYLQQILRPEYRGFKFRYKADYCSYEIARIMQVIQDIVKEYEKIKEFFLYKFFDENFLKHLVDLTKYSYEYEPVFDASGTVCDSCLFVEEKSCEQNEGPPDNADISDQYNELMTVCTDIERINAKYRIESAEILQKHKMEIFKLTGMNQYS